MENRLIDTETHLFEPRSRNSDFLWQSWLSPVLVNAFAPFNCGFPGIVHGLTKSEVQVIGVHSSFELTAPVARHQV